ncbi:MAG: DUF4173 domain-containing protein [Chloroflexi bacterium]|nr:DUF4173 domain-containing protein [Chloroflexota bacterium]
MLKKTNSLFISALALGWIFDYLFWKKPPGINFAIFTALCLATGFALARGEGIQAAHRTLWLLIPITFFAVMSLIRGEPLTTFLNRILTLLFMAILASTFRGGRWLVYSLGDYLTRISSLIFSSLWRPADMLVTPRDSESTQKKRFLNWKNIFAVVSGLILAFPVIIIFTALLSSADPIFSQSVGDFLDIFFIEDFTEYIFRMIMILFAGYLLAGVYIHAINKSDDENLPSDGKPRLSPFLGFTEATIVLGSVVALFFSFVLIQIRYFFGGIVNIAIDGFTYAEYARRGFFELVAVAFFSLLLFLSLSLITKRAGKRQQIFSGLGITLFVLVGVMLVSAFQRLNLYEQAFGFSRLRTYTHTFIFWLGALLLTVVLIELSKRQRAFALAALAAIVGFTTSLNLLNVDAFIAKQNVTRLEEGKLLDIAYLASLSEDVVPTLSYLFASANEQEEDTVIENIAGALACHAALNNNYENDLPWQAFHLADFRAASRWDDLSSESGFRTYLAEKNEDGDWFVDVGNEEILCIDYFYFGYD